MFGSTKNRLKARKIVYKYSAAAAGAAVVTGPIPGTSLALTGIEAKMVYDVARVYNHQLTLEQAAALVGGLLVTGEALKNVAVETATALPGVGWYVLKPAIGGGACVLIGEAAIRLFEDQLEGEAGEKLNKILES